MKLLHEKHVGTVMKLLLCRGSITTATLNKIQTHKSNKV